MKSYFFQICRFDRHDEAQCSLSVYVRKTKCIKRRKEHTLQCKTCLGKTLHIHTHTYILYIGLHDRPLTSWGSLLEDEQIPSCACACLAAGGKVHKVGTRQYENYNALEFLP